MYIDSLESYRKGLDLASIQYGSLAVELGLVLRVKQKTGSVPNTFGELINIASREGILTNQDFTNEARKIKELRNIYVHLQSLLHYLASSVKRELGWAENLYEHSKTIVALPWMKNDRIMKRVLKDEKKEFDEKNKMYSKLKDYMATRLRPAQEEFIKSREQEYKTFISYKYEFADWSLNLNKKNYEKWKKAQEISKTLAKGDLFGLYDITRFDAVNQLEWSFHVLQNIGFIKKEYGVYYDRGYYRNEGEFTAHIKPEYRTIS